MPVSDFNPPQRPTFFCASFFPFFALSAPPFPTQFSSPKSPLSGTSDLLFLVEKRQPAGAGFWGRFWTGSPRGKKGKSFFSGARKKVSRKLPGRKWGADGTGGRDTEKQCSVVDAKYWVIALFGAHGAQLHGSGVLCQKTCRKQSCLLFTAWFLAQDLHPDLSH